MQIASSRWVRAFLFGILAEVATILSIIITVLIYKQLVARGLTDVEYGKFGVRAGGIVGLSMGTIYVFLLAWPVVRTVETRKILHGVVVAAGAMALQLSGSMFGHHALPMGYAYSVVLKLAAGAASGWLAWRVPYRNPA